MIFFNINLVFLHLEQHNSTRNSDEGELVQPSPTRALILPPTCASIPSVTIEASWSRFRGPPPPAPTEAGYASTPNASSPRPGPGADLPGPGAATPPRLAPPLPG